MADDDEWKYSVEDFEDPEESDEGEATDVFGDAQARRGIEPESPSFENALFVVFGVALALLILLGV